MEVNLDGINIDVEDFPWAIDSESTSMSWDWYSTLYDSMTLGNKAFRDANFLQAIDYFTGAYKIKPDDPIILSNRCAAYLQDHIGPPSVRHWACKFLRSRTASDSDNIRLNGFDATTHASLALKDAEKVMTLRENSVSSYVLKAYALIMLEKYELARDVICSGLEIDPRSNLLLNLGRTMEGSVRSHVQPQRMDDYDCTLCLKLLYEPFTTPCGHSFCRSCMFQCIDRGNRCPLCRTVLFVSPRTCAISVTLNNIIQKNFPEEYAERKLENDNLTNPGVDVLPLFAMEVILPCQKTHLNIFEPRYRLMVRRIMEGNRRMGMVDVDPSTGSIADYACEVEITDCEPLPDGRFFLEVESRRRCHIIRSWDQDGYRIAEVEWVDDDNPPEGTAERNELLEMTQKAAAFARQWIQEARLAAQRDRIRLADLLKAEGLMPPTQDPERFSFWLATLTNRRRTERLDILRIKDTKERIRRGLLYMKAEERSCALQ